MTCGRELLSCFSMKIGWFKRFVSELLNSVDFLLLLSFHFFGGFGIRWSDAEFKSWIIKSSSHQVIDSVREDIDSLGWFGASTHTSRPGSTCYFPPLRDPVKKTFIAQPHFPRTNADPSKPIEAQIEWAWSGNCAVARLNGPLPHSIWKLDSVLAIR